MFEDMVTGPGMAALWRFLNLAPQPVDGARRVHEGRGLAMTAAQRARARDWLAPQYEAAARALDGLPPAWGFESAGAGEAKV